MYETACSEICALIKGKLKGIKVKHIKLKTQQTGLT
jgi:hypothetical protein